LRGNYFTATYIPSSFKQSQTHATPPLPRKLTFVNFAGHRSPKICFSLSNIPHPFCLVNNGGSKVCYFLVWIVVDGLLGFKSLQTEGVVFIFFKTGLFNS
jgi:hypothetical protein